jgi:uncharacterized membrane protein YkvA (DUF1232 family)
MAVQLLVGIGFALLLIWVALLATLAIVRPPGTSLSEALRLLPDTLRLLHSLVADGTLDRGVRLRLWLLFGYLAFPIDLVPDFIPILGFADDAIIVGLVLRSVVRRSGSDAVERHWSGSPEGLAVLWKAAGLPPSG